MTFISVSKQNGFYCHTKTKVKYFKKQKFTFVVNFIKQFFKNSIIYKVHLPDVLRPGLAVNLATSTILTAKC